MPPVIAMIPLDTAVSLAAIEIQDELETYWPGLSVSSVDAGDDALTLQLGCAGLAVAQMPMPIPEIDLEAPNLESVLVAGRR